MTRTNHILQNKEIGESLSGKEGLADAPAQSCLVPTLDIMFLLIHAARCKRHVALTGLISFPSVMLPRKRAYTNIHKHTQTYTNAQVLGVKQRANEHDSALIDHLNN